MEFPRFSLEDILISRSAIQKYLEPGGMWNTNRHDTNRSDLSYEFRFVCSKDYYGPKCDTLCKPRNDTFGHFTCSPEGKRICNHGWTGEYCTQGYREEGNKL
ncbi:unnamed protein product [Notodromas monacha]|uniref:Delta-like protein n=1 Tax=Notodromas monacha TaxID=399045 RepID=A0A7R9G7P5_9CRUS|nr:unnamed protein product [Notodromas monacha]CAG0912470.1 unnamed protein product [Notodromas monacha]